jgi:hypothetical protein
MTSTVEDLRMRRLGVISLIITLLMGCTITHTYGELPEVHVDNPYADKTKIKFDDGAVMLKVKWNI